MITENCDECGKCCLNTEMSISKQDIIEILHNYPKKLNEKDFAQKINKNHYRLRNIDGYCYFFNNKNKLCRIYEFRPQGCRFYPIIYDNVKDKCIYDDYCPRRNLFFLNKKELKKKCLEIKKFLLEQLRII